MHGYRVNVLPVSFLFTHSKQTDTGTVLTRTKFMQARVKYLVSWSSNPEPGFSISVVFPEWLNPDLDPDPTFQVIMDLNPASGPKTRPSKKLPIASIH